MDPIADLESDWKLGWAVQWPGDPAAYITHIEAYAFQETNLIAKIYVYFKDKPYPQIVPLYQELTAHPSTYVIEGTKEFESVSQVRFFNYLNSANNKYHTLAIEVSHTKADGTVESYLLDNRSKVDFSNAAHVISSTSANPSTGAVVSSFVLDYSGGSQVFAYEVIKTRFVIKTLETSKSFLSNEQTAEWPDDPKAHITHVEAFAYEDTHTMSKLQLYFKDKPYPVVVALPGSDETSRLQYLVKGTRVLPGVTSITFFNFTNPTDGKLYTVAIQVIQATFLNARTSYFIDNRGKMTFKATTPLYSSTISNRMPGAFISSITFKYKNATAFEVVNTRLITPTTPATFAPTTTQQIAPATSLPTFVDPNWSPWSEWSACNPETKTKMRTRVCNAASCVGDSREDLICPYDGVFGEWSDWTTCMLPTGKTCGAGQQMRGRSYTPAIGGGKELTGPTLEYKDCYTSCPNDGNFSEWSPWSDCLSHRDNCGDGEKKRTRTYNPPTGDGRDIEGPLEETMPCFTPCPVDGEFAPWSEWTPCVEGEQTRTRTYIPPQNGGKEKEGALKETQKCTSIVNSLLNLVGLGSTQNVTQPTVQTPTQPSPTQPSAPQTSAPQTSAPQTSAPQTSAPQTSAPQTSAPQTSSSQTSVTQQSNTSTLPIKDPTEDPLFTFDFSEHWWILLLILIFIILVVIGIAKSGKKKADEQTAFQTGEVSA